MRGGKLLMGMKNLANKWWHTLSVFQQNTEWSKKTMALNSAHVRAWKGMSHRAGSAALRWKSAENRGSCVNSQHRRRSVQKPATQKRGPRTIRKRPKGHLASSPPPDVDEQTEFRNMPSKQTLLLTQLNGSGIQLQAKAAKKPHVQCKAKTGWKEEGWERHAVPPLMQNAVAFINVR